MIQNIIPSIVKNQQHKEIYENKIKNISRLLKKNNELKREKEKANSKLLINNQILEASKRDIDERKDNLNERIEELKVHKKRKEMNSNHYISNFKELEMYIQTECLNTKWASLFYKYDLITFLSLNEALVIDKTKEELNKSDLLYNIAVLKKENKEIQNTIINETASQLRNIEYYYIEKNQRLERKKNSLKKLLNHITIKNTFYYVENNTNQEIDSIFGTVFTDTGSNFKTNVTNKMNNCILSTNISKIEEFKTNIS